MSLLLPVLALAGLLVGPGAATAAPLTIRLISVGSVPPVLLGFLQEGVTRELGAVVQMGGILPLPASCLEGAGQCQGGPFLAALAAARPQGEEMLLGVTGVDLTVPDLNFVFGLADPRSRVAVISLARLYPEFYGQPRDPGLFKARVVKEAVHELGHLLGLSHCPDPVCIMAFSNSLADTDRKGPGFCPRCRELLQKKP
jgi:archaemetzincin